MTLVNNFVASKFRGATYNYNNPSMYSSFQYFCSICVLFDKEKGQYHCKGCGLCRLGGEDKFFHCDKCEMCLPVSLQPSHKVCITYFSISDISFKTIRGILRESLAHTRR